MQSTSEPTNPRYALFAAFLFRGTGQGIDITMCSLGAYPKAKAIPHPGWMFASIDQPLLEFDLIKDTRDYAIDLPSHSWKWYIPLFDALGITEGTNGPAILHVAVRNEVTALNALRPFALKLLENHAGVVKTTNSDRVWSREAIAGTLHWPQR